MAHVLILNVALFVPVVLAGAVAAWVGWVLAGPDSERNDDSGGAGGGGVGRTPRWPSPVVPTGGAGPDDLARSA